MVGEEKFWIWDLALVIVIKKYRLFLIFEFLEYLGIKKCYGFDFVICGYGWKGLNVY